MPVFFQQQINENTRLGVWKIEETEEFFKGNVPVHRDVTHPHKRLQHLAGRFLLQFLFPDFPYSLIQIADTSKPFLPGEQYHFSISHCGDYAAAIVSSKNRVGVDVEIPTERVFRIKHKFLSEEEIQIFNIQQAPDSYRETNVQVETQNFASPPTLLWSAKEAVFKWFGSGEVDFREHIQLRNKQEGNATIICFFSKTQEDLIIHYRDFDHLLLTWVVT